MNFKRLILIIFLALTAGCATVGLSACAGNGDNENTDHGKGEWDILNGVYVAMASDDDCPAGDIDESLVKPEMEMRVGGEYYLIIDFTLQPLEDNDGRGTVDVSAAITPAAVIDVKLQETSSGTYTENTYGDTKEITVPFSVPEKAEEARDKRIVLKLKPLAGSEYRVSVNFAADRPLNNNLLEAHVEKTVASQYTKGLEYVETDEGGFSVSVGLADKESDIVIPYYKGGKFVTEFGSHAFTACTNLKSINISERITGISDYAFSGCSSLTNILIPENVTIIGDYAFSGCSGLNVLKVDANNPVFYSENNCIINRENKILIVGCKSSLIPDNVVGIGEAAFSRCSGLESVTIPDSVIIIESYAFSECVGLNVICIPDSVVSIGDSAFFGCNGLTRITIPFVGKEKNGTSNTHFGYIFGAPSESDNSTAVPSNLKTVEITGSTDIGNYAFCNCSYLTSVTLGNYVTSIGEAIFYNCNQLTNITVKNDNVKYYSENNCVIEKENKTLVIGCKSSIIPDGVTCIGDFAFLGSGLTEIIIPSSVISIGMSAFYGCNALTCVSVPESVTDIGSSAFGKCPIETAFIPAFSCNYISNEFLKFVIIISGEIIDSRAFYECRRLASVTISESVTTIGSHAFFNCNGLTEINYKGTMVQWSVMRKDFWWNYNTGDYIIHCTDGDIKK